MRTVRKAARKPPVVKKSRKAFRGFGAALRKARNNYNIKYVYDTFELGPIQQDNTKDQIFHYNVRVSDFPTVNGSLNSAAQTTLSNFYGEYKCVGIFAKIDPINKNYIRNNADYRLPAGYPAMLASWPLTHFSDAPATAPNLAKLRQSNGVKWIPILKPRGTQLKLGAFFESVMTVNDETTTTGSFSSGLHRMPFVEYSNTEADNMKFAPFAVWLPKAYDANTKLSYNVTYHAVFALRNNARDVVE